MKTSIITDCMKSSNVYEDFTHISNDISNGTNSPKLSIDIGNSNFLELDKLNLSEFTTHLMTTLIIGKREVGKTQLIKDFMVKMKNNNLVDLLVIFTNESTKLKYIDLCVSTDKIITKQNDINILKNLIDNQEKNPTNKLMIIIDDFFVDKKLLSLELFKKLIFNARYYNIGIIISIQFSLGFSPEIRAQMDLVMVYNDDIVSNQKRLYEHYFGMVPTFNSFNQIIKSLNPYECLVCDNLTKKKLLNEKLKYYKSCYIPLNEANKIELFNVNIIENKTNEINKNNVNKLIETLQENNKKIFIILKENEKITKEFTKLAELTNK